MLTPPNCQTCTNLCGAGLVQLLAARHTSFRV
ncbi:hypothetical protein E2C01_102017 [Portunus trituberculatus]|uniref:Uncharacterized protein n=1 Tax=Portunus trituberculatus TaxID=210409 RepID=A0A5B7KG99_PORTR|nr:hypothetical protein [Portunus trituberculatus]